MISSYGASFSGSFRHRFVLGLALTLTAATSLVSTAGHAQTSTTGAISGTVTDATGAILPGAKVIVTNTGTGEKLSLTADSGGRFAANLLKPGTFTVSATSSNFASDTINVLVALGGDTDITVKMVPVGSKTTVEVSAAEVPLIDTQNIALVTTFNQSQIENLPTPGGDVTTVAFTLPGVVVNAGGSYGNFSSDGLPGVSNLFVLNGFDNQDPFLNLNNSGSSNLTLGQGELAEVSVVQNAYNSQYGRAAGAIINYTTKSGTNHFHGMIDYTNNASIMNANGWFNNFDGGPRPHAVSNEWAANIGGPIIKDKLFFFADYEGLRYVLPGSSGLVNFPSPQLQAYTLATVPSSATALYKQAFAAYQGAPSYANATPVTTGTGPAQDVNGAGGCGSFAGTTDTVTGGTFGGSLTNGTEPCISTAFGSANNINKEWLFTGRADYHVSAKQDIYARYKVDHGSQPTYTNFINPLFNAVSIQPEDEGQLNDNYRFSPNTVNSFTMAANWYSAYFGPANNAASAAVYPDFLLPDLGYDGSGVNSSSGLAYLGVPGGLTQGRDVTQYQFEDDFSYLHGKHTLKAGFNFRRDLVTDYDSQSNTVFPQVTSLGLQDYVSGSLGRNDPFYGYDSYSQAFSSITHAHLALYNVGIYAQDEFQATSNLKLTLGIRFDRTGNPLCNDNCFSQYQGAFPQSGASLATPYIASAGGAIASANAHPFSSVQSVNVQPRFGFNYSPKPGLEIRGGVGIFSDLYPAGFLDGAIQNFPNYNAVSIYSGVNGSGAGSLSANAAAANAAVQTGFTSGQSLTQINNSLVNQGVVDFIPPGLGAVFPSEFKVPEYVEYSLQIQKELGKSNAIIVTYAANHGYDLLLIDPYENPAAGVYSENSNGQFLYQDNTSPYARTPGTFGGQAIAPPDPRFSRVTAYTNGGTSNYNGLLLTFKHTGNGFTGQVSYTYSHALDTVSNGGSGEPFNGNSVVNQLTPSLSTLNLNYASADYDVRHNVVGDFVYEEPTHFSNRYEDFAAAGWIVGVKTYARTGEPYSVTNSESIGSFYNDGTTLLPEKLASHLTDTCAGQPHAATLTPCLNTTDYLAPDPAYDPKNPQSTAPQYLTQNTFGNIARNSFRGPHYVDTDLSLNKRLVNTEKLKFMLGSTAFNVFNHPNFGSPNGAIGTGTFGLITSTLAPPTSPYGSFQGAAVTQRVLVIHGRLTF